MSPKWIKYILMYYSLWGFCFIFPIEIDKRFFKFFVFSGHIALCLWCIFCSLISFSAYLTLMEVLDALNFFAFYVAAILLYITIIYDSHSNQTREMHFWKIFSEVSMESSAQSILEKWSYLNGLLVLLINNLLILLIGLVCDDTTDSTIKLLNFIFFNIIDNRMLFYFLHLKLIAFQLSKIGDQLNEMQKSIWHCDKQPQNKWTRSDWIQNFYGQIYEMSDHVNLVFGWSNVMLILISFYSAVTFLNFCFRQTQIFFEDFYYSKFNSNLVYDIDFWLFATFVDALFIPPFLMTCRIAIHIFFWNKYANNCYGSVSRIFQWMCQIEFIKLYFMQVKSILFNTLKDSKDSESTLRVKLINWKIG